MNFCRLPPDRLPASASSPLHLTLNAAIVCCANSAIRDWRIRPPRTIPARAPVSSAFCARLMAGTAPRPSRSSGTKPKPSARRCAGSSSPADWPPIRTMPLCGLGVSPDSAASSSFWPLPETPAMPTISPRRTRRLRSSSAVPNGSRVGSDRWVSSSSTSPGVRGVSWQACSSPPIISRARLSLLSSRGIALPLRRPPRSTVARSQSVRISSSLWLM